MSWRDPVDWHRAVRFYAKSEGRSPFSWLSWLAGLSLLAGVIVWDWSDADPEKRASIPVLISLILTISAVFVGMGWLNVRLNRTSRTTIYEKGILHGSLLKKRWIPWSEMAYFYTDEDTIEHWNFRFLSWRRIDGEGEEFSVVPDEVDLNMVIMHLETSGVPNESATIRTE